MDAPLVIQHGLMIALLFGSEERISDEQPRQAPGRLKLHAPVSSSVKQHTSSHLSIAFASWLRRSASLARVFLATRARDQRPPRRPSDPPRRTEDPTCQTQKIGEKPRSTSSTGPLRSPDPFWWPEAALVQQSQQSSALPVNGSSATRRPCGHSAPYASSHPSRCSSLPTWSGPVSRMSGAGVRAAARCAGLIRRPGAVTGISHRTGVRSQDRVQLIGAGVVAAPLPTKPKVADAPAASAPLWAALRTVTAGVPTTPFQSEPMLVPAG
jgi:hypothetical protein